MSDYLKMYKILTTYRNTIGPLKKEERVCILLLMIGVERLLSVLYFRGPVSQEKVMLQWALTFFKTMTMISVATFGIELGSNLGTDDSFGHWCNCYLMIILTIISCQVCTTPPSSQATFELSLLKLISIAINSFRFSSLSIVSPCPHFSSKGYTVSANSHCHQTSMSLATLQIIYSLKLHGLRMRRYSYN